METELVDTGLVDTISGGGVFDFEHEFYQLVHGVICVRIESVTHAPC